jgi:hypothetical protein
MKQERIAYKKPLNEEIRWRVFTCQMNKRQIFV